jgi:hypothetical protein
VNREQRTITLSGIAAVVASLLFLYFYTGEPPVTPVGEQVGNQTGGSTDEIDLSDELLVSQDLKTGNSDPLNFTESVKVILAPGQGGSSSGGGHHGGGGGGGSRDRTPPTVTGIFSREPDTVNKEYNHPVTVNWTGVDEQGGSGIDHCDVPTTYSGPDGVAIVLEGHCFDKAGNKGTGNVTLNFNSAATGNLAHFYDLTLDKIEITVGSDITANATTNNTSIKNVKFIWKDPANIVSTTETIQTVNDVAVDSFAAPDFTGVWSVEAHFLDIANNDVMMLSEKFTVVQRGGGGGGSQFTYGIVVNPETVEKNNAVTATATTNNTGIQNVTFVWTDNLGSIRATQVQPMSLAAVDSFTPDSVGQWTVVAHFNNATHLDVAARAASFTVTAGGSTGDTTAPTVNGIFSRDPDTIDGWYTHPVTITWEGVDEQGGSGIASCEDPVTYSGPDALGIVLEGHCTDNAGNTGTGSVNFNYNETATGGLTDFYDLSLSDTSVNLGSNISANATTNNTSIKDVRFVWRNPSNGTAASNIIPTLTNAGIESALDMFAELDLIGTWAVDAHFLDTASNDVFVITKHFVVVSEGGVVFTYELSVNPETVEKHHTVIANATTNNTGITDVLFVWTNPDNIVKASHSQTMDSVSVSDSFSPDAIGEWKVVAHFNNSTDSDVSIRSETFTVIREGGGNVNHPPIVNAGPDQIVKEKSNVDLSGLGSSDPDGDTLAFSWKQTQGPTVVLNNPSSATPSFTAPEVDDDTVLMFELTVNDGFGGKSTDSVKITVVDKNGHGGGGDDDDDCDDQGHEKDKDKDKHDGKDKDHDKCKCHDDNGKHKGQEKHDGKDKDKCKCHDDNGKHKGNGGNDDDDCDDQEHEDNGNHNGANHDHEGSDEDRNDSAKGNKDDDNEHSEKGTDNSGKQDEGSHDNSGPKEKHEGDDKGNDKAEGDNGKDKTSDNGDNKNHDSDKANKANQGSNERGSEHDDKESKDKESSSKASGSNESGDKGGKDDKSVDKGSHDKKSSNHKDQYLQEMMAFLPTMLIEWFKFGFLSFNII